MKQQMRYFNKIKNCPVGSLNLRGMEEIQSWGMRPSILQHLCDKATAGEALGNYLRVDCKFSPLQVAELDTVLDMNSRKSRTSLRT